MINSYLIDSISIKYLTGLDQWQEPSWSTVAVKARVEWSFKLIRNAQGEEDVAAALVYLGGDLATPPTVDDKIIIDGVEHVIMRVDKKVDFSMSHYECWIT